MSYYHQFREKMQMSNKYEKMFSTQLIKEMQIKTTGNIFYLSNLQMLVFLNYYFFLANVF